jgi:hypothetical protein
MKLVWTSGGSAFSRLIQWGLDEPVSHFAIVFDDRILFQSNLLGTGVAWYPTFLKKHRVVFEINIEMPLLAEEAVYQSIITKYDDRGYDYGAFGYFMWRAFLKKFFGRPIPSHNPWQSPNAYLCIELVGALPVGLVPNLHKVEDLGMTSPYQLYLVLSRN